MKRFFAFLAISLFGVCLIFTQPNTILLNELEKLREEQQYTKKNFYKLEALVELMEQQAGIHTGANPNPVIHQDSLLLRLEQLMPYICMDANRREEPIPVKESKEAEEKQKIVFGNLIDSLQLVKDRVVRLERKQRNLQEKLDQNQTDLGDKEDAIIELEIELGRAQSEMQDLLDELDWRAFKMDSLYRRNSRLSVDLENTRRQMKITLENSAREFEMLARAERLSKKKKIFMLQNALSFYRSAESIGNSTVSDDIARITETLNKM